MCRGVIGEGSGGISLLNTHHTHLSTAWRGMGEGPGGISLLNTYHTHLSTACRVFLVMLPRNCEACDCGADREICAAHAIRAEKVAISAGALYGCPWLPVDKRYRRPCIEHLNACIPEVSRSKTKSSLYTDIRTFFVRTPSIHLYHLSKSSIVHYVARALRDVGSSESASLS